MLGNLSSGSIPLALPVLACTLATSSCVVFTLGVRAFDAIFSFRISPTDVACVTEALADTRLDFMGFFRRVLGVGIRVALEPVTVPAEHAAAPVGESIKTAEAAALSVVVVLCVEVVVSVTINVEQILGCVNGPKVAVVEDVRVVAIVVVVAVVVVVVTAAEVISNTKSVVGTLLCVEIISQLLEPWLKPLMLSRLPSPWISGCDGIQAFIKSNPFTT